MSEEHTPKPIKSIADDLDEVRKIMGIPKPDDKIRQKTKLYVKKMEQEYLRAVEEGTLSDLDVRLLSTMAVLQVDIIVEAKPKNREQWRNYCMNDLGEETTAKILSDLLGLETDE